MRAVIQRVSTAGVEIDGKMHAQIGAGLCVLVAVEAADTQDDIDWLAGKICRLRIFDDENGVMNRSVLDAGADVLVVSQFTLYASTRKGNRPSYIRSAPPPVAIPLYEQFLKTLETLIGKPVAAGVFGAMMRVHLTNEGPVTILIDTKLRE
jgi:D-tyrosyl-tRNA(Tyr) deacylase